MLWTRAGVYGHLFSISEGLDVISNVLKEREGREREREEGEDAPVRSVCDFAFCFILQYLHI